MTLQDRIAMFQSPSETKKTFQGEQRKNKFADKLAVFQGPKPDSPTKTNFNAASPTKSSPSKSSPVKQAPSFEANGEKQAYKFQVQTHSDSLAGTKTGAQEPQAFENGLRKTNSAFGQQPSPSSQSNQLASPSKQQSPASQSFNKQALSSPKASDATQSSGQTKCEACTKTVYVVEQIMIDDKSFHKNCLKCSHCSVVLKLGNYASLEGTYYCKPHFMQLFKLKGNYSEGFGNEPHKNQWRNKEAAGGVSQASEEQQVDDSHQPHSQADQENQEQEQVEQDEEQEE